MANALHDRTLFVRLYVLLACASCGIGVALLVGGQERFSEPDFRGPRALLGWLPLWGAWAWWGVLFVLIGVTLGLTLDKSAAKWILRAYLVVAMTLAVMFFTSAVEARAVSGVWGIFCLVLAFISLFLYDHLEHFGWQQ